MSETDMIDDEAVAVEELVDQEEAESAEVESIEEAETILNHGVLSPEKLKAVIEAAIFASGEAMSVKRIAALFDEAYQPSNDEIRAALTEIGEAYHDRGVELSHVASGYRFQAKAEYAPYLQKMWEKKPPRFSRAMLETLALIAYRQPITRGEIEEVRGVSTSSHIMKVLVEREWVKIVAYKDVPGKPAMYGTTKDFLDYFNLQHLKDMPDLKDLIDLDQKEKDLNEQLVLNMSLQDQTQNPDEQAVIAAEDMQDDDVILDSDNVIPGSDNVISDSDPGPSDLVDEVDEAADVEAAENSDPGSSDLVDEVDEAADVEAAGNPDPGSSDVKNIAELGFGQLADKFSDSADEVDEERAAAEESE